MNFTQPPDCVNGRDVPFSFTVLTPNAFTLEPVTWLQALAVRPNTRTKPFLPKTPMFREKPRH